jgi:chromate reductase, NAD(P)H dehydrogenase (quinone)
VTRILAISGSLRRGSLNTRLLREPAGVGIDLYGALGTIPPYDADEDRDPGPPPVRELRDAIADADGLLFATPEYNASIPGVLKNAIDWASRPRDATPFQGKPAAVVGATTGQFGAVWAQAELRKVLSSTGARVVDLELPLAKAHELLEQHGSVLVGDLVNSRRLEILATLIAEVDRNRELSVAA